MGLSRYRWITLFLATLTLLWKSKSCDAGFLLHKTYVEIRNNLPDGTTLSVGCKSGDDDLGRHDLGPYGTFSWRFRPNFWGITLFWCHFQWNGGRVRYYDIYIQNRDYRRCKDCLWDIKPDGPCLFNYDTQAYDGCDKWNPS